MPAEDGVILRVGSCRSLDNLFNEDFLLPTSHVVVLHLIEPFN